MSPKFLSALLSLGNPCLCGFLERTSLEFQTGFWQIGSTGLALLSLVMEPYDWAAPVGGAPRAFPSGQRVWLLPISFSALSSGVPRGPLPGRPVARSVFLQGTGAPWNRAQGTAPSLPCLPRLHILEPRFPLLNFSQVKYSIGLLESKVLRLTD